MTRSKSKINYSGQKQKHMKQQQYKMQANPLT